MPQAMLERSAAQTVYAEPPAAAPSMLDAVLEATALGPEGRLLEELVEAAQPRYEPVPVPPRCPICKGYH